MVTITDETQGRTLRADAERNRVAILDAASDVFAEEGFHVSVADIARRAGVGNATLFRRFPTKDDLVLATIERKLEGTLTAVLAGLEDPDPVRGFRTFIEFIADQQATDRTLCEMGPELAWAKSKLRPLAEQIHAAAGQLLQSAKDAGAVRADLEMTDLMFMVNGAVMSVRQMTAEPTLHRRYVALILDGLLPQVAGPLPVGAPDMTRLAPSGD